MAFVEARFGALRFAVLAVLAWIPLAGIAQPSQVERELAAMLAGTLYTIPHRESADGSLRACGIEFAAAGQDFSTRRGAMVKVVGSYYVRRDSGSKVGWSLKLAIFDGVGWSSPVPPNYAFIRSKNGPAPEREHTAKTQSETPGFALIVGTVDKSFTPTLKAIADQRQVVLGFNRVAGQQDVVLPIDMTVQNTRMEGEKAVRQRSQDIVDEFMTCVGDLLKNL